MNSVNQEDRRSVSLNWVLSDTLAEGLNITQEEYEFIERFVLNPFTEIPSTSNLLIINGIKNFNSKGGQACLQGFAERTYMGAFCSFGKNVFCQIHRFR